MPTPRANPQELVRRLDARHDELLRRLEELNAEIEHALAEFVRTRDGVASDAKPRGAA
jgi:hypothetical protein